jgi:predicted DNA-binding protein
VKEREGKSKPHKQHSISVYVPFEIKEQIRELARKYDRTTADMVRAIIKIGIPMMQGLSEAEEIMVTEYIRLFRQLRQVRSLKEI